MNPLRSFRSESFSHCEGAGTGSELTGGKRLRGQILLFRPSGCVGGGTEKLGLCSIVDLVLS